MKTFWQFSFVNPKEPKYREPIMDMAELELPLDKIGTYAGAFTDTVRRDVEQVAGRPLFVGCDWIVKSRDGGPDKAAYIRVNIYEEDETLIHRAMQVIEDAIRTGWII